MDLARRRGARGAHKALPTYWSRVPRRARAWRRKFRTRGGLSGLGSATDTSPKTPSSWQKYERETRGTLARVRGDLARALSSREEGGPIPSPSAGLCFVRPGLFKN